MRSPEGARRDPLLKFGVAAVVFAMLCAGLVVLYVHLDDNPDAAGMDRAVKAASATPLDRSDPGVEPWREERVPPPEDPPDPPPEPTQPAPEPEPRPDPPAGPEATLPAGESDWPAPTAEQIEATKDTRRYDLPPGAPLGLSVPGINLYDVPVLRSNARDALDRGVIHARGTSMPWSATPERNVYLAGHRLGWPGTGSHLIFYRLDELARGDEVVLTSREGERYRYRVTESFVVKPDDTWVMGRVVGEDMLTLQTCTPIPGFQKRLIVRAERV